MSAVVVVRSSVPLNRAVKLMEISVFTCLSEWVEILNRWKL